MLSEKGLLEVEYLAGIHMEGASNLLGLDLHLTRERMRELCEALEEKQRLDRTAGPLPRRPPGELAVHVGLGICAPCR